jgi:hypothetical protein
MVIWLGLRKRSFYPQGCDGPIFPSREQQGRFLLIGFLLIVLLQVMSNFGDAHPRKERLECG